MASVSRLGWPRCRCPGGPADDDGAFTFPVRTSSLNFRPPSGAPRPDPADAGGQALEGDALPGGLQPAQHALVLREELLHGLVGDMDVLRSPDSATQRKGRCPAE